MEQTMQALLEDNVKQHRISRAAVEYQVWKQLSCNHNKKLGDYIKELAEEYVNAMGCGLEGTFRMAESILGAQDLYELWYDEFPVLDQLFAEGGSPQ